MRGNELSIIAETPPIGIPHRWLNPAGIADFDGDGVADLAIPSLDRRSLRFIALKGGAREIARKALPSPAVADFSIGQEAGKPVVIIGLGGGRTVKVRP